MKKRVLVIGLRNKNGGIEKFFLENYKLLDKKDYSFDFASKDRTISFNELIKSRNDKFVYIPHILKHPIKHYKILNMLLKNNNYDIVHCNFSSLNNVLSILLAKKYKVKKIIIHSHNSFTNVYNPLSIFHFINRLYICNFATDLLACSKSAGKFMFGKHKFKIINNTIDVNIFKYNIDFRNEIRKDYNIKDDEILIGTIGRLCYQNNHIFLLKTFNKLLKYNNQYKLMIVGNGKNKNKIKKYINNNNLNDKVILIDSIDTNKIYNAFDVFALPSRYEGLPLTLIEAQANGVAMVISNKITKEGVINKNIKSLSIRNSNLWIQTILNLNIKRINIINKDLYNYDIKRNVLKKLYENK